MLSKQIEQFLAKNKYPAFKPKAVFFDMDGVLYDSMKNHASAWVKAMNQSGFDFTLKEAYMNEGRTGGSTIDLIYMKIHGRNATEEEKQAIYDIKTVFFEATGKTERMPFAWELLQKVKAENFGIFLVTGSGQDSLLSSLEIDFPGIFQKEKMVTAYDVTYCKPHPEPYLTALKKSGLQPWEVVVIENAPLGVESSNAAGLFTIGVNTGPIEPEILLENGANVVFDGMKDLYENWENFVNSWS